ncbi:MAG TPA: tetratricopeptide repeat protein [Archangium sp.]|uniref:tetratricopeptide repeat protein n=1 Tax=Archangium sp. TaxID=1872627 RepID=UPI002E2F4D45|nr:tetratricopeptide repeat protein [Archangium sp.]HEX5754496.1 tetratricopeptide repeat protein [Archangium sp.]
MGPVYATNALLPLVDAYHPRYVAMCGVCAGRPGKTLLGDVIAAERLFFHDTGKRLTNKVQQDLKTYNLRDDWKVALEHFDFVARFRDEAWWKMRPVPYEWQENWVLAKLREGIADPSTLPDCDENCPQWEKVINLLWKSGDLQDGTLTLSDKGRERIGRLMIQHRNRFPDTSPTGALLPFKVHVAPIGSGQQVVEDEKVWGFIGEYLRKTVGMEMEAAAIGALAHAQRERKLDALVMKGVMDFANEGRDDHFKEFAARASAECLLAFLRDQIEVEMLPDIDDILVSGADEELPENPPPSALLNARYEVVPFHEQGREAILAELERWCVAGPTVAVRMLHAEGGVGKTRLAIEWIRRRRALGEAAGFLPKEVPEDWFERLGSLGQPVLVVIDYAESRSDLREMLMRVHRYSQQGKTGVLRPMRILLLARNNGDWWQSLRSSDAALGTWLDTTPPYELPALAMKDAEREQVFHEAAARFAAKRGKAYGKRTPFPLSDEHFERVLYLHMAALAAVEELAFNANRLMDVILDHEERFWDIRARQADVTFAMHRSLARQVVAAATLRGGLADHSATSIITGRLLGRAPTPDEDAMLRLLHRIYQRTKKATAVFLPALEPDLLGEGVVLRVASPKLEEDRPVSDWISRVFPPEEATHVVVSGFEILGRASASHPDVVRPWLEQLLSDSFQSRARIALLAARAIGLRTAFSALGDVLADRLEVDGDVELARELSAIGIPTSTVSLRRVAEWTSRTLLQAPQAVQDNKRTKHLNNKGTWFRRSATWTKHIVLRFLKLLMGSQGLAKRAALLNNWGIQLLELGHREEALVATREAVEIYRTLVQRNSEKFRPDLAMSHNNLGNILGELGRHEEAIEATREAIKDYRALAQHDPETFRPELAHSLNNLGLRLRDLGRREEAPMVTREAVDLYRMLAQRNPDTFWPDLAMSLHNLGATLIDLGHLEEALKATREAVELRRTLVQRNPDAFQPVLASSLSNLGATLTDLGSYEEGLKATREAVELRRALVQRNPNAFQPDLAMSLNNLGIMLRDLGHHKEAMELTREAVELYRVLAQCNSDAFRPYFALSLNTLGTVLRDLGLLKEALEATREAVELRRELAQRNPDIFRPALAVSLNNLGAILRDLDRFEEALASVGDAVDNLWPFFERLPSAFGQNIKIMLRLLLALHKSLQRPLSAVLQERMATFERLTPK